jgi:DNA-3-methyladenine glycosylase I
MLAMITFMSGLSRRVVLGKWPGILKAFHQFDIAKVAAFTPRDVDAIAENPEVIRYRAKIEAVVDHARTIQAQAAQHGSVGTWLEKVVTKESMDAGCVEIAAHFKFISPESARRFLWTVGLNPEVEEQIVRKYGMA